MHYLQNMEGKTDFSFRQKLTFICLVSIENPPEAISLQNEKRN